METMLFPRRLAKFPDVVLPESNRDDAEVLNSFRERVRTYINNRVWSSQQSWLFPTSCAQYGWKCVSSQLLQCETCHSTISPAVPNRNKPDLYQKCLKNTLEKIETSHKKHCPWPLTPAPDHYVRVYPMHKEEAYAVFVKHLKSLYVLKDQLPCIKDGVMEKLGVTSDVCSSLCKIAFHMEEDFSQSAILLAITGWSKDADSQPKAKLQCSSCQRSVPLFMYTTIASSKLQASSTVTTKPEVRKTNSSEASASESPGNSVESKEICDNVVPPDQIHISSKESDKDDAKIPTNSASKNPSLDSECQPPSAKKGRFEVVTEYFDPLYEHRPWCPFLIESGSYHKSKDQSTPTLGIPGWQLFLKCLLRNTKHAVHSSDLHNTPLKDQMKYARHMLQSWNSPN